MAWIEYHTALRDHWKIKRLATVLEVDYLYALGAISCLWLWVAEYAPEGNIKRFSNDEIRDAARCNNLKMTLEALKSCELVDAKGRINDWNKHGLKLLVSKRNRQKEYMKRRRHADVNLSPTLPTIPNQPNLTKPKEGLDFIFPFLKDSVFKETFENYLSGRKKKATDHAKKLILKDLHQNDIKTAIKRLEQSIKNGWVGIFELKEQNQSQGSGVQQDNWDKVIAEKLGRIATKDMIKEILRVMPKNIWWKVGKFLRDTYKNDGGKGFSEAEREIIAELNK